MTMYTILPGTESEVRVWSDINTLDFNTQNQLRDAASLPWVDSIASMPDAHLGYGVPIGSVVALRNAISPAAVGVDIGCGMAAVKTSLTADDLPENLANVRNVIEASIPVGFNWHETQVKSTKSDTLWARFGLINAKVADVEGRARQQHGTLGGGNHFIEVCLDEDNNVWLMLHSGSRNIGKQIAEQHIAMAKALPHNQDLPESAKGLSVFLAGSEEMTRYEYDLFWAQEYAKLNREIMLEILKRVFADQFDRPVSYSPAISCHHNYVSIEEWDGKRLYITRKGAISAKAGQPGIIPGSMGASSFIVEGLGNPDSFASASHGAGRTMSRGEAKRTFSLEDLEAQTAGIECRKDAGVIDEIPGAYKNIDEVMARQSDLVTIKHRLRQVVCVKG